MEGREILVVEDDPRFSGLIEGILAMAGFSVRCADGGVAARALASAQRPDAVVLDLGLPDANGAALVRELVAACDAPILVLTSLRSPADVLAAIRSGAAGLLFKEDLARRLLPALEEVLDGGAPLSVAVIKVLMAEVRASPEPSPEEGPYEELTARERDVLTALARGLTYDQVGLVLDVSENTVRSHVRKIYHKLGAASRTEAVLAALRHGMLRANAS